MSDTVPHTYAFLKEQNHGPAEKSDSIDLFWVTEDE
jgi:hypothetical protein